MDSSEIKSNVKLRYAELFSPRLVTIRLYLAAAARLAKAQDAVGIPQPFNKALSNPTLV